MRVVCAIGHAWGETALRLAAAVFPEVDWIQRSDDGQPIVPVSDAVSSELKYVFFLNWSRKVDRTVTSQHECVNFHCTPLPYGRGGHPVENMLMRGHATTVITAHRMTDVIDGGPVYMTSQPVSLTGSSKADVVARFARPCAAMMMTMVGRALAGKDIVPVPQDESRVVRFGRLSEEKYAEFWRARK